MTVVLVVAEDRGHVFSGGMEQLSHVVDIMAVNTVELGCKIVIVAADMDLRGRVGVSVGVEGGEVGRCLLTSCWI